jgi:predicted secreted protein
VQIDSIFKSAYPFGFCLFACLFVCLFVCLFACLFVCFLTQREKGDVGIHCA